MQAKLYDDEKFKYCGGEEKIETNKIHRVSFIIEKSTVFNFETWWMGLPLYLYHLYTRFNS